MIGSESKQRLLVQVRATGVMSTDWLVKDDITCSLLSSLFTFTSCVFDDQTTPAAPQTAKNTPKRSLRRNCSFRRQGARIALDTKVVVPSGAIVEAGANP
jgi:hypothetical protein